MSDKKTETFTTEVSELLQLIIHSLYSHPEIFLRELISNASDALDKLKIEALTDSSLLPANYDPYIRLIPDKEAHTLTIKDNGIGMSEEEVRKNLGTIAHSGTKQFLARKEELKANPELIGQFGVGFYSAFIVADKVTVLTRKAGAVTATRWESDGKGEFSIENSERTEGCGTTITLHLKPAGEEDGDLANFAEAWTLRSIVKKHSDFIAYPIKMEVTHEKTAEEGKEPEIEIEDQTLNSQKALWLKSPSEVTDADYNEFYRSLTFDSSDPLHKLHYKAEGTIEFSALVYFPASKPWNYDYEDSDKGLQLYVKRVLIMNNCEDLLPLYLRFVKGIVDSSDLSLNVSRELLQQNRQIAQIKKAVTNKVIKELSDLLTGQRPNYEKLWQLFGNTLKEGILREPDKKEKLLPLYMFKTTFNDSWQTLDQYVERMKEGQPAIYFIVGEDPEQISNHPHLERIKEKGYEVILLSERIDEFMSAQLDKYKDHKFQSILASDLELDSAEEKEAREKEVKEETQKLHSLIEVMQSTLKDDVKEVRVSTRLTDSPVCLVADGENLSPQLEAIYKQMGQPVPKQEKILEINPKHPIFGTMQFIPDHTQREWAELLYEQARISEGGRPKDPKTFSKKLASLMLSSVK